MSQEINIFFEVGDMVVMSYPTENIGRSLDYITDLGLVSFFKEMDGKEFVITERTYEPYLMKNGGRGYRFLYRLSGIFKTNRGTIRSPGSFWYEGYWLNPIDVITDDKGLKFFD